MTVQHQERRNKPADGQHNGSPPTIVRAASKQSTPRELDPKAEQGEGKATSMMLPYLAGIIERIKKAYSISVVFRRSNLYLLRSKALFQPRNK